jgi:ABC-type uncharacterized transport system substrate-binding protein
MPQGSHERRDPPFRSTAEGTFCDPWRDRPAPNRSGGAWGPRAGLAGVAGLVVFLLASSALPSFAGARPHRVAIVVSRQMGPYQEAVDGFRRQIQTSLPQAEITVRDLDGDLSRGASIAESLASASCDLIDVVGTDAYKAMAGHSHGIPIVISMVYDPQTEFRLEAPRDSAIYGVALRVPLADQLDAMKRFCPKIRRVSILYGPESPVAPADLAAASARGIELVAIPVERLDQLEKALDMARSRSDAFLMALEPSIYTKATTQNILLYFMRAKMPVFSFSPNYAKAGALLSVSSRYDENGAAAARLAADILAHAAIRAHFVPTPRPRMDWNERAAETLGIELSRENRALCTDIYGS